MSNRPDRLEQDSGHELLASRLWCVVGATDHVLSAAETQFGGPPQDAYAEAAREAQLISDAQRAGNPDNVLPLNRQAAASQALLHARPSNSIRLSDVA